ncbi:MAG: hypothetical protein JKX72_11915, partial [Robiginitomaculum sp.]|nr:hypothetical protein [Robiginitomaculum sp.]
MIQGQSLILPSGVVKSVHNANSIKPYDPTGARGDLNPTSPEPPKESGAKGGCGGILGKIFLVIVAVAVSLATFNPATGAGVLSTFAASAAGGLGLGVAGTAIATTVIGGAIAGAVGSIASQVVGVATGIQDKFSWKGVALAAIGGEIGGGVVGKFGSGAAVTNLQTFGAAGIGAGVNVATQGIGVATGLQDSFSWAGVAAAGIGAGVGGFIGHQIAGEAGSKFAEKLVTSSASAIANAATRSAIEGSNFGDNIIAAIPDVIGGAIGGYIGSEINGAFDSVINSPEIDIALGSHTLPVGTPSEGPMYVKYMGFTDDGYEMIVYGQQTRNFDEVVYAANAHRWSQQSNYGDNYGDSNR